MAASISPPIAAQAGAACSTRTSTSTTSPSTRKDARVLYATGFESAAWRSADRGLTWKRIPGFDFKWAHRVIVDPQDRSMIYITTFGGSVWHGPSGYRRRSASLRLIHRDCNRVSGVVESGTSGS